MDNRDVLNDIQITEDLLYTNNTFNLNALNDTLEKLTVTNFWSLYQTQRSRLNMKRFQIPFHDFIYTSRLEWEKSSSYSLRRHVAYVDYAFIEPELRKRYRNSDFYNIPIDQETISKNMDIFKHNYLVFISGELLTTVKVYPMESKLGIIIDIASGKFPNGISYDKLMKYKTNDVMVDFIITPNYYISTFESNEYRDRNVLFNNIDGSEKFTENTLCFSNSDEENNTFVYDDNIIVDIPNRDILINDDFIPITSKWVFKCITFGNAYGIEYISDGERYFKVDTKLPCPTEQILVFDMKENEKYGFDSESTISLCYPNIYTVSGDNDKMVFVLYDTDVSYFDESITNEVLKYEEYIDMLPKYNDGSIPELLKTYRPSSYVYSIDDYKNSLYVPSILNYKAEKLRQTIVENPWVLATYLDLLNLPTDKFYLDMEKIDLSGRLRTDNKSEAIEEQYHDIFDSEHYVFAMNRHYVTENSYGFHIFIDGLFQMENAYKVYPGKDFFYIYIPVTLVKEDSVIEIERYRLFNFEVTGSTDNVENPLIEMELDKNKVGYTRELYVVDVETSRYLNKKTDFRVEVLYGFAENGEKWATVPMGRSIPLENKFRIYLANDKYLGRKMKIGINRTMVTVLGEEYTRDEDSPPERVIFDYDAIDIVNQGGYDVGYYRTFNHGRLLLPAQYFVEIATKQGWNDIIRTSCDLNTGDQLLVDRVPARFELVYYQNEIDVENKKGYVDLDGKIELPISLKWYDIYLNGIKLHKKNIEIISPTKFYIQGVDSRKHLMIMIRNRDPEVFKLADGDKYIGNIMDSLMDDINGLKQVIDGTKDIIDPTNETPQIVNKVVANQSSLIFFYEYMIYTFINANWKQITQDVKDAFPSLVNGDGVFEINPNEGCISSDAIGGYLIKLIECNYTDERSKDMFVRDNVNYDGLGVLQDRFAIRPLSTTNYEYALNEEFMCDPETGEASIRNEDGTVTSVSTLFRTKNFIESFSQHIMMYGMGKSDIYQIVFDEEFKVMVYENGNNIITEDIVTPNTIKKFAIGLDASFLKQDGESKMLKVADSDPMVTIVYLDGTEEKTAKHSFRRLHNYVFESIGNIITLKSITLEGIEEGIKTFVHSLLIAF